MDNNNSLPQQPVGSPVSPPQQPSIPQQEPMLSTEPPHKSRKLIVLIIVIIILLLILTGVGFFVYQNQTKTPINTVTPTPIQSTPELTQVPTKEPASEMTLEKGVPMNIPGTDIVILYVGADIPNPNCMDCSTTTELTVEQQGVEKKLNYHCGGISGACTESLTEFGYEVSLVEAGETSAKVSIQKQ